jgi:multiple sugar transport system permease protein
MEANKIHTGRLGRFAGNLVLAGGAVIILLPFWEMIVGSLKTPAELYSTGIRFFPAVPQWNNYTELFSTLPIQRLFLNSIFISCAVTVCVLFTSSLAGFALAKYAFRGRNFIFKGILSTMMFPQFIFLIPVYFILKSVPLAGGNDVLGQGGVGLLHSYTALIVPFIVNGFGIFLMRQFVLGFPDSLLDAARIDGCSEFGLYWRVVLPLCKPVLATLAIFAFIAQWNEYIWTVTITTAAPDLMTLPVGIQMLRGGLDITRYEALMRAAMTIAVVPSIALFVILQKSYIRSLSLTGLKE